MQRMTKLFRCIYSFLTCKTNLKLRLFLWSFLNKWNCLQGKGLITNVIEAT
jgi:hypothetical protein